MSAVHISTSARAGGKWFAFSSQSLRGASGGFACRGRLVAGLVLSIRLVSGQEAWQNSPTGEAAAEVRQPHPESQHYTFRSGEFRLLVTPSLEMDWNDNIALSKENGLQDLILRPLLEFTGSYPVTPNNLLRFNVGVGYDKYLQHSDFSDLRLVSGSELAFDAYIKDFWINLHERFQYLQDPAEQGSLAATGRYGGLDNTAGLSTTWNLQDLVLTLGYDHENFVSSSSAYAYLNRASELFVARVGLRLHPRVTAGFEAGGSLTTYDQTFLNDNQSYSGGIFADWKPGSSFRARARGGYMAYLLDQTSQVIKGVDQDTVYADVTVSHEISEAITYSFSAGHELRLGTSADLVEDTYLRPSIDWNIIKNLIFSTYLSYEHGKQGQGSQTSAIAETYDWLGTSLRLSHQITKKLSLTLKYRLTVRSSDVADRQYAQNLVGLRLTYQLE